MSDDEQKEVFMEDAEAKERSERNPQGADKRQPDRKQGHSVPEGANDASGDDAGAGTGGAAGGGGASYGGGSQGQGGGASQGGGTGN